MGHDENHNKNMLRIMMIVMAVCTVAFMIWATNALTQMGGS